jgi:hypothetical protein
MKIYKMYSKITKLLVTICSLYLITVMLYTPDEAWASRARNTGGDKGRVVCSYLLLDKGIIPGEKFKVKLTFENVGSQRDLSSILINYTNSIDSFFSTDENSGQIYIPELKPNSPYEVTLELNASETIQNTTAPFVLSIVYADSESSTNTSSITMQFPISLRSYLTVNAVSVPDHIMVGEKVRMRVTYRNAGAKDLYNINMNIDGDGIRDVLPASLGKLSVGKTNYVDIYVVFTEEQAQVINIGMTYEDVQGTTYTADNYEVKANVIANDKSDSDVQEAFSNNANVVDVFQKYNFVIKIALLCGIVISGIVILILLKRYYKEFK